MSLMLLIGCSICGQHWADATCKCGCHNDLHSASRNVSESGSTDIDDNRWEQVLDDSDPSDYDDDVRGRIEKIHQPLHKERPVYGDWKGAENDEPLSWEPCVVCVECGTNWPCRTMRALSPQPTVQDHTNGSQA